MTSREFKTIREATGLNMREFGRLLGMGAATVLRKERGDSAIKIPEAEMVRRIAQERGIKVA